MDDIHKNVEEYQQNERWKILIISDGMIVDMLSNKNLKQIVTELFIRERKLNISFIFITKSYFAVPKNIRLNSTHYFLTKNLNKRELQQITLNHSSDIDLKDFMNLFKKWTAKLYSFLVIDNTLGSARIFLKEYKSSSWQLKIKLKMKH